MFCVTTDYRTDAGDPEPYLRRIAQTGFTHVHWCHEWNTDFLYPPEEMERVGRMLSAYGLQVLDLHGSSGKKRNWVSPAEAARRAGVELVVNRIELTSRLGGDVVIMHVPRSAAMHLPGSPLEHSLEEIRPVASRAGVRIAIENRADDSFEAIRALFAAYGPEYLGLCYDSGHGNIGGRGLDHLEALKDRLISVHLHDNDGASDQHRIPFTGTVDWGRLGLIIAGSSYRKCVSTEANMRRFRDGDEGEWLGQAFAACERLSEMIQADRADTLLRLPSAAGRLASAANQEAGGALPA